jgi:hypothetical protein
MDDNLLFFLPFIFPKKKSEEEKENELAKLVLNKFFGDSFDFNRS